MLDKWRQCTKISGEDVKVSMIMKYRKIGGITLLLITYLLMLSLSWRKWNDEIIDSGDKLYLAWQLKEGKVLYKDIYYVMVGPFSPYFNSWIFKIFGTSYINIVFCDILLTLFLIILIFRIFRKITDFNTALIVSIIFITVFACSQYVGIGNYNYIWPYAHSILHALLLSHIIILLLDSYYYKRKKITLSLIGFFAGILFLTKAEIFFSIFLTISIMLSRLRKTHLCRKEIFILLITFLIPILIFILYFHQFTDWKSALKYSIFQYLMILKAKSVKWPFYLDISGLDNPLRNFCLAIKGLFVFLIILASYLLINFISTKLNFKKIIKYVYLLLIPLSVFWVVNERNIIFKDIISESQIERAIPFLLLFFFLSYLISKKHNNEKIKIPPLLFSFFLFSFTLLFKIILNTRISHYGIFLAMPATLLISAILLYFIPKLFKENGELLRLHSLLIISFFIASHFQLTKIIYSAKILSIGKRGDKFYTYLSPQSLCLKKAVEILKKYAVDDFVVFPEGIMLNYLARKECKYPYLKYIPLELYCYNYIYDDPPLNRFKKYPPSYVIIISRPPDIGYVRFGFDYGKELKKWIEQNYNPYIIIGNDPLHTKSYGILIMKKKNSS